MKRTKLEGEAALAACVAAGVPTEATSEITKDGCVVCITTAVPCAAYITEDGHIQVFQGPNNEN